LKPAVKPQLSPFTKDKAWRVNDRQELLERYETACALIDPAAIMIQELIPGAGGEQFSYAALCLDGSPVATVVARRSRQYPIDFGRSSTFVETVEQPHVEEIGQRIVREMRFTGLVEIEFKRDPRSGVYKLLDINPRIWGWHTLGQRAGVDFSYLLWRMTRGESITPVRGRAGARWMRLSTDVLAGLSEYRHGRLSIRNYLKSLCGSVEPAVFAPDDPLPGLLEIPLGAYLVLKRRWL
jgi:predicted ATP-grasp superfamily ATP-dependent carboligase